MAHDGWMPPAYLRTLRALMPGEPEYGHVEYLLKLAVRSASLKVLSVHALHSFEETHRFNREHENDVVLDSWCATATLPEDNTVAQIAAHGGRFRMSDPQRGVLFPTGCIRLTHGAPGSAAQFEFLLLRLATGRAFIMDRDQVGQHPVPDGYHSVKIAQTEEEGAGDYFHEYMMSDETRIWPAFVVNCVYDPEDDRRGLAGMHHRVASWRVQCYQDAYTRSMDDLDKERRNVEEKRRVIVKQLESIDERIHLVKRNHAHAQDEIYSVVQQVVQLLHARTQGKLNLLLSDDAELRRQLQYFEWLDTFLGYQKELLESSLLDPVEFLQNVERHRGAVMEAPSEIVDSYQSVHADIKVVGNLTVQIDDSANSHISSGTPSFAAPPAAGQHVWGAAPRPSQPYLHQHRPTPAPPASQTSRTPLHATRR